MLGSLLATQALAGSLTVVGTCTVASNLTFQQIALVGDGTYTLGRYSSSDAGQGVAYHRLNDGSNSAYLNSMMGWGSKAALQAYNGSNETPSELSLNVNGGQVSVCSINQTNGFDVGTNAVFHSAVWVDGKLYHPGGIDPAYLLLDVETRTSLVQRVSRELAPDKQNGAALFFNQDTKQLEVYIATEGVFYNLAGNAVASLPLPAVQASVGRRIWFDSATGEVVTNQILNPQRYQILPGYQFDPVDGNFYQLPSGPNSNSESRVQVPESEAVTLTPSTTTTEASSP